MHRGPRASCSICGDDTYTTDRMRMLDGVGLVCPADFRGMSGPQMDALPPLELFPTPKERDPSIRITPDLPLYQKAEAECLNLMLRALPYAYVLDTEGSQTVMQTVENMRAVGWACVYAYNCLVEDRRPNVWLTKLRAQMATWADYLISRQLGGVGVTTALPSYLSGYSSDAPLHGGFAGTGRREPAIVDGSVKHDVTPWDAGIAGLALLRAYQLLGTPRYRTAYMAAAQFLRRCQALGYLSASPGAYYGAFEFGGVAYNSEGTGAYDFSHQIWPRANIALEFLHALKLQEGDITLGYTPAPTGFTQATARTISGMIADCVEWWATGWGPQNVMSSTNPYEYFENGNFYRSTSVTGENHAYGVRGLWACGEFTGTASTLYTAMMAGTSNATYAHATTNLRARSLALTGTYDPAVALANTLSIDGAWKNADSTVRFLNYGILAPIQSEQDRASFTTAKRLASERVRYEYTGPRSNEWKRPSLYYSCGIERQVAAATVSIMDSVANAQVSNVRIIDMETVALVANAYRLSPRVFVTRDHPES